MCNQHTGESQEIFDEELYELYLKFKDGSEEVNGNDLSDNEDDMIIDFCNYITENIKRVV